MRYCGTYESAPCALSCRRRLRRTGGQYYPPVCEIVKNIPNPHFSYKIFHTIFVHIRVKMHILKIRGEKNVKFFFRH